MNIWAKILCGLALMATTTVAMAGRISVQAQQRIQQQGTARVVVMLQQAEQPPAISHRSTAMQVFATQRARAQRIKQQADTVLSSLPGTNYRLRRRFSQVPALVLDVDGQGLRRLEHNPRVVSVDIDHGGTGAAMSPDESSVLNHVDALQPAGLDGRGMKVAVIDSGVDTDHLDIAPRLVDQQCFCSSTSGSGGCCPNGQATQSGKGAAEDDHRHGSNVAGIIIGQGRVAPRGAAPAASLVAVKVLDRQNRFCCSSDVVAALDWLASQHPDVDVVNLSLGSWDLYSGSCDNTRSYARAMKAIVQRLNEQGTVVVASAGNQGNANAMSVPACLSNVLGIAVTWDSNAGPATMMGCTETSRAPRQPVCFSNRSATTAAYAAGAMVTSAGLNGGTSVFAGTSQAAPMVAACQLALKQASPASTVAQRMDVVGLSHTRVTDSVGQRYPFLDCTDAVNLLNPAFFSRKGIPVNGSQPKIPPPAPSRTQAIAAAEPVSDMTTQRQWLWTPRHQRMLPRQMSPEPRTGVYQQIK